jgi:hypothetical protein
VRIRTSSPVRSIVAGSAPPIKRSREATSKEKPGY